MCVYWCFVGHYILFFYTGSKISITCTHFYNALNGCYGELNHTLCRYNLLRYVLHTFTTITYFWCYLMCISNHSQLWVLNCCDFGNTHLCLILLYEQHYVCISILLRFLRIFSENT